MVAFHLDNSTAEAYLCNLGSAASPFLSMLVCHILNVANKYHITLIAVYISTHLNAVDKYLSLLSLDTEWDIFPHIAQVVFQVWHQQEVDLLASSYTNQHQHY